MESNEVKGKGETIVERQNLSELMDLMTTKDRKRPCEGDPCPLPCCRLHPRLHFIRPHIALTGAGVMSASRPSGANGLTTMAEGDTRGACR